MVKPPNAYAAEQRINAAAEKIMALDSDLRRLSWTRIREIAVELAASDLPASERLEYARELDSIAATNLALIQRQQVLSAMEEGEGEDDPAPDEHAAQQARVASASAAVLSQIQADIPAQAEPAGSAQQMQGAARAVASAPVGAAGGFQHPEFPEVPDLAESDSSAGLAQRVSRKLDSLMDAVGLAQDDGAAQSAGDAVPIADADAGEAPNLKAAAPAPEGAEGETPGEAANAATAEPAEPVEDANYDAKGRWRGDTAPMNVVQMLNAEMVYQSDDEDDKDRYAALAAQASLYDDPVAVILPSADELEGRTPVPPTPDAAAKPGVQDGSEQKADRLPHNRREDDAEPAEKTKHKRHGRRPRAEKRVDEPADSTVQADAARADVSQVDVPQVDAPAAFEKEAGAPAAPGKRSDAKLDEIDRLQVPEVKAPGAPGAGGTKPADPKPAEGEPSISVGFSSHSRAERAILAERERKEAAKREKKDARKHRFSKIFGRRDQGPDDLVVIPRGKAKEAPDDLFVSDRHRAAAEKRQEPAKHPEHPERSESAKHPGHEKHSHAPSHAKAGDDTTESADANDAEGHKAGSAEGARKESTARGAAGRVHSAFDQREYVDGDQLDRQVAPATFELFHTSRDGRVSFFRDAEGRITAVNSARLI